MELIKLNKEVLIISKKISSFLNPTYIYIPIKNNKLLVRQNEKILKNQYLFKDNYEIMSPVSGIILGLTTKFCDDKKQKCLVIKNDFKEKRLTVSRKKAFTWTIANFLTSLEEHHLSFLLKKFRNLKRVKNIIINTVEDETYSESEILLFKENIDAILSTLDKLSLMYQSSINNIVICEIWKDIIEDCINTLGSYPNIKLALVNDYYLLGQEQFLLDYLKYDRKDTLYLTVTELMQIYNAVINNLVEDTKLVTISGNALVEGKVIRVKKYCSLEEIMNNNFKIDGNFQFWVNGLLKGKMATLEDIVITDQVTVINVMQEPELKTSNCFNCGKCVRICPVGINVAKCYKKNKTDKRCLNCGLCNYICPSFLNLKAKVLGEKE